MSTMPESVPGPVMGAMMPDSPQPRSLTDIAAEFDAALWADRRMSQDEMRTVRMFFQVTEMKIQAFMAGQQVGPGLEPPMQEQAEEAPVAASPEEPVDYMGDAGEPVEEY